MSSTTHVVVSPKRIIQASLVEIGGAATIILAVCGLVGVNGPFMAVVATIVFGVAQTIQGRQLLIEFSRIKSGSRVAAYDDADGLNLALVFLSGASGLILGVLALLGVGSVFLTPAAVVVFGAGLVLGAASESTLRRHGALVERSSVIGNEILASQSKREFTNFLLVAGLSAVILGVFAVADVRDDLILNLIALLCVGLARLLGGGGFRAVLFAVIRSWSA